VAGRHTENVSEGCRVQIREGGNAGPPLLQEPTKKTGTLVEPTGIEPVTYALRTHRSPN
jgi:hypothetical protein